MRMKYPWWLPVFALGDRWNPVCLAASARDTAAETGSRMELLQQQPEASV